MREAWTDERLDDLSRRVDRGFDRVDADLRALNGRFDALQQTLNALQRTMLQVGVGLVGALLAVMVTVVGLAITQI